MKRTTRRNLLFVLFTGFAVSLSVALFSASPARAAAEETYGIADMSVSLTDDIVTRFYAKVPDGAENVYMTFSLSAETETDLSARVSGTKDEDGRYSFAYNGVTPQYLSETITATLYYTVEGTEYSDVTETGVKAYLEGLLSRSAQELGLSSRAYAALAPLVGDILDYGAAAQAYVNYKADSPSNGGVEGGYDFEAVGSAAQDALNVSSGEVTSVSAVWKGANLRFGSKISLLFAFDAAEGKTLTDPKVKVVCGTESVTLTPSFNAETAAYIASFSGIGVLDFDTPVVVQVWDGDEAVSEKLTYSVATYVSRMKADEKTGALARALWCYGYAAEAYNDSLSPAAAIRVSGAKTQYVAGQPFDTTGMVVEATFENGKTALVTDYTVDITRALTTADTKVTVTFEGVSAEMEIAVEADKIVGIAALVAPTRTIYTPGEVFVPDGMILGYRYLSGKIVQIDESELAEKGYTYDTAALTAETKEVAVTFDGYTVGVPVTVLPEVQVIEFENYSYKEDNSIKGPLNNKGSRHWMSTYASGTDFMADINAGDVLQYEFYSTADRTAHLIIRGASNYVYVPTGTNYPTYVKPLVLNTVMTITLNGENYAISSDKILPGIGVSEDGTADKYYWVNWADIDLGEITLKEGYNCIRFDFINPNGFHQPYNWAYTNRYGDAVGQYDCIRLGFSEESDTLNPVTGISLKTPADKLSYVEGQIFDATGMVIEATYADGSTKQVTNYKPSVTGALTTDMTQIVFTYGDGMTVTQAITVEKKIVLSLEVSGAKTQYAAGETFDESGMTVTAIYNDGDRVETTDYVVDIAGKLTTDITNVPIRYQGVTYSLPVTVTAEDPTAIVDIRLVSADAIAVYYGDIVALTDDMIRNAKVEGVRANGSAIEFSAEEYAITYAEGTLITPNTYVTLTYVADGSVYAEVALPVVLHAKVLAGDKTFTVPDGNTTLNVSGDTVSLSANSTGVTGQDKTTATTHGIGQRATGYYYVQTGNGGKITLTVNTAQACTGSLVLCIASGYVKQYGEKPTHYYPAELGEMVLARCMTLKVNGNEVVIGNDVILKGASTGTKTGDIKWLANWMFVQFNDIAFEEGENTIEFTFKTYTDENGNTVYNAGGTQTPGTTVDYVDIRFNTEEVLTYNDNRGNNDTVTEENIVTNTVS